MIDGGDTVRDGRLLDTLDRRDKHKYHSSFGFDRHDDRYHYHPYKRSDMGYFLDEIKKKIQLFLMEIQRSCRM